MMGSIMGPQRRAPSGLALRPLSLCASGVIVTWVQLISGASSC